MASRTLPSAQRARGVTAVLGPTNTGKTHYAIERMLAHSSGMIGLPLRLLAREVYNRIVERVGVNAVALVTGEEKIKPRTARYWVATVEAMPIEMDVAFVAVDEIQLAADPDRGHVFTDRLLNVRGRDETLLIGAATMKPVIERLLPGVHIVSRPRLSQLSYAGDRKITRQQRKTAIVAFSAEEVYSIAELIRRQRGGAAVVLGALSPRTRNAQVDMYQSGEVEFLIATDAIGMGLNLDIDHVAFAASRKFDGHRNRYLTPAEFGQVAGRAGRYLRDGTFGTTGRCDPLEPELVDALENHRFDPVQLLHWRNADLDFFSIPHLIASLDQPPADDALVRAQMADDQIALEIAARDDEMRRYAGSREGVKRLWDVCQIPDYRRLSSQNHAELVHTIYRMLIRERRIRTDWFAARIAEVDRTDGDIDTLSTRIAHVRTWTFVANRSDWLSDPEHWQGVTRRVEDSLSDALHERLTQRFVDRRTSVLMRRLRENAMLEAEISTTGDVIVEGHPIGRLHGFQFAPDPDAGGSEARALRATALKALAQEFENRATRVANAVDDAFALGSDGSLRYLGEVVGKLTAGEKLLEPRIRLLADEQLTGAARDKVQTRVDLWLKAHIAKLLGPLQALETSETLTGIGKGIAFQVAEALGVLERARVHEEVKGLDQAARAALRSMGVRFGAYHLTVPALLKPAPRGLAAQLWALKHGGPEVHGLDDILHLASSGRTSIPVDKAVTKGLYRAAGFRICGERAVRVDILERLADLIRPAIQYRPGVTPGDAPTGAADGDGFVVTTAMTSLCGCAGEDFATILRSLGYVVERRAGPAITVPLRPLEIASVTPVSTDIPAETTETAPEAAIPADTPQADEPAPAQESAAPAEGETAPADDTVAQAPDETATPAAASDVDAEPVPEVATETTPVEPQMTEIWRQHRHHHQGRPPRDRQAGRAKAPTEVSSAAPSGDQPDRQNRNKRHGDRPRGGADRRAGAEGRAPNAPSSDPARTETRPTRHDERRDGRPGRDRADKGGRGGPPQARSWKDQPKPAPREKEPDPDSPFAKLLALKAELEAKGRK
jgi:ATP-dependent RNA helicase SUPV3L1/SUV3